MIEMSTRYSAATTQPIARVLLAICVSLAVSAGAGHDASNAADSSAGTGAYEWPLKPFDQAHPVRAVFGDPRTVFLHAGNGDALASSGSFSFHDGVDIDAPRGSTVYPVVSGVVRSVKANYSVCIQAADGRAFVYTHIVTLVRPGQAAVAGVTVLGRVRIWNEHLHFSEFALGGHVVNPLLPGHLTPYRDTTRPAVTALDVRVGGRSVSPLEVHGRIALVADAHDLPMLVDGKQVRVTAFARDRFGVTPATMGWSLSSLGGRAIVRNTTLFDYRRALPENASFWRIYARGTYQNRPPVVPRYHQQMPGRYVFLLTSGLDTTTMRDGVYVVTVTATDARGNTGSLVSRIEIRNRGSERS
jgi:peptidase M23-like protein